MTYQEAYSLLEEKQQTGLLRYYDTLDEAGQKDLLQQIENLDWSLFEALSHKGQPVAKGHLTPMPALEISEIAANEERFRSRGLEAIRGGKVAAVLLAGGQGTRLGLDKPKGMLNVGITHTMYLFEILIGNLKHVTDAAESYIPLYIMTSEKNHEDTTRFFAEENYFGYPAEYVHFFKQEMAPSVDYDGKILLEAPGRISLSPNGNGGWFSSMNRAGLLPQLHSQGVEWLNIFSVDNVLQRIADPVMIGATLEKGYVSSGKVVRKADPDERVGVLCLEDGKPSIVEYYEMTDEIRNTRLEDGSLAYGFGVTLNYLFRLDKLEAILSNKMPLHVVEKKIPHLDENGNLVKPEAPNGYKFETLILDMVHMMDNCLPTEIIREEEFAPIKNRTGVDSLESARELLRQNHVEL